jgi:D-serine dehydratase
MLGDETIVMLGDDVVDWRYKGVLAAPGTTVGELREANLRVDLGDLPTPVLTLRREALRRNLDRMAEFCRVHECRLAPHVKTTMSPELWRLQLEAGAWGLTVATFGQLRTLRAFGAPRIMLANQLVDRVAIEWLGRELAGDSTFEFFCLVDSVAGVRLMEEALGRIEGAPPVQVLVELGYEGGRTGCRSVAEAVELAGVVAESERLELRGVEGFEGYIGDPREAAAVARVDSFLIDLATLANEVDALADSGEPLLVSAGGSVYFDRVVECLGGLAAPRSGFVVVLRSGCYLTHDSGFYERVSPLAGRGAAGAERLESALDLWAAVVSRPEPELAIANFGRRDAGQDAGLPVPHSIVRGGRTVPVGSEIEVVLLHDQHAHLRLPESHPLAVGDLIVCGVSHPCTTVDKWRLIPVIDDAKTVVDAVHVFF